MVAGLAFLATAIATVFAQATGVRYTRGRKPHERAWIQACGSSTTWLKARASRS